MTREEAADKLSTVLTKMLEDSEYEDEMVLSEICPEILRVYQDYMNPTKNMNALEFMENAMDEIVKYNSPLAKALR